MSRSVLISASKSFGDNLNKRIDLFSASSKALIADFDVSDEVIMGLIFGEFSPSGRLPFELPSSVQAVEDQKEDVPYDSKDPLYEYGHGMRYANQPMDILN